ncbi:MAG: hypothetical protein H6918_11145 [Sphingomonadaceae bacterium]|nr:hypothetical protein [Sphingomonadaceae bacterium]
MKTSVTHSLTCAASTALSAALLLTAAPLAAQEADKEVVTDREPGVEEVATTPIRDLNLAKDDIPAVLQDAAQDPYADEGLTSCDKIGEAIAGLDDVLGGDLDVASSDKDNISIGRIARSAVGSFIPFRSIVREVSGAAAHQRQFERAILAGAVRRGYLKGLGQQMGCPYPARPAFTRVELGDEGFVKLRQQRDEAKAD